MEKVFEFQCAIELKKFNFGLKGICIGGRDKG